jgi:hypothetical protein
MKNKHVSRSIVKGIVSALGVVVLFLLSLNAILVPGAYSGLDDGFFRTIGMLAPLVGGALVMGGLVVLWRNITRARKFFLLAALAQMLSIGCMSMCVWHGAPMYLWEMYLGSGFFIGLPVIILLAQVYILWRVEK